MAETFIYTRPLFHDRKGGRHFESDTSKVIRKHLEDPFHIISQEEIRQVRIGMLPPLEELLPQLQGKQKKNQKKP